MIRLQILFGFLFSCAISFTQTIFKDGEKYGLLDQNNQTILKAEYDTIFNPSITKRELSNGYKGANFYIYKKGNKQGFAYPWQKKRWNVSEPIYDSIEFIKFFQYVRLNKGKKYQLLWFDYYWANRFASNAIFSDMRIAGVKQYKQYDAWYDTIYSSSYAKSIVLRNDHAYEFVTRDGIQLKNQYDTILEYIDTGLYQYWSNDSFQLLHDEEVVVDESFKEGELTFHKSFHIIEIVRYGQPIEFIDLNTGERFYLKQDGENVIRNRQANIYLVWLNYLLPNGDSCMFFTGTTSRKEKIEHGTREWEIYNNANYLSFTKRNQEPLVVYSDTSCGYFVHDNRIVQEIKPHEKGTKQIRVKLYDLLSKQVLYEYVISDYQNWINLEVKAKVDYEAKVDYYEISLGQKSGKTWGNRVLGYLDKQTLKFYKTKEKLLSK